MTEAEAALTAENARLRKALDYYNRMYRVLTAESTVSNYLLEVAPHGFDPFRFAEDEVRAALAYQIQVPAAALSELPVKCTQDSASDVIRLRSAVLVRGVL